ncbi:SGNH/GDSL hydrolase family protein [Planctomicrobium sp. SH668]|uniref:SGNH/GDSL hydrolase family protein n=1 Tax=Planctomicrobium sp. SH668 TaxID=3448126 RepID=UPI003F5C2CD7
MVSERFLGGMCAAFLFVFLANSIAIAQDVEWRQAGEFEIEGMGWADTSSPFVRLPDSAKGKVSESVWNLSRDSAGICIRFQTDASSVKVRWSVTKGELAMPHMPATGVSGVDLYTRTKDGKWSFVANGRPHVADSNVATMDFVDGARPNRECLLYLPTYNGTKSLEIGVAAGSQLAKPSPRPESLAKPVLVYGTSIVQGGCASRPGLIWTSILGRLLDRPMINLGFSGNGRMEPPTGEILAELDPALFVVDCIWNIGDDPQQYQVKVPLLVKAIRGAHPETPILFVGQSHIRNEQHPTRATKSQEEVVQSLIESGVAGLHFVSGTDLLGDDEEGTVDGVHPNDIGMDRQARALQPVIEKLLQQQ